MKLDEFKKEYVFTFDTSREGRNLIANTEVFRRSDNQRMGSVESTFDFYETDDELRDSQTPRHIFKWDWDKLIEETKRVHLDHFAKLIPIEGFLPRNRDIDIESHYI